jgi:Protein of unknown function (DUF3995)
MTLVATFIIVIGLGAVAFIHLLWACGSNFPATDEKTLARTVAGFHAIEKMPPKPASALVAAAMCLFSLWPLIISGYLPQIFPSWISISIGVFLALVFGARGVIGFTKFWRKITPEQPFATLDRKYYSPFCLLISFAFITLVIGKLI